MKMDYRRDLQHNYLVAEDGEDTENYITRMMTENQVQGLLGCECRRMDQKKLYYYDITSKISLAEKCRYKKIKGSEVLLVVQGLLQVLVQLEEYLIPADRICLDWNYIYLCGTGHIYQFTGNWSRECGNFWKNCFPGWIIRSRTGYR